ncbi:MAG: hypothetical protein EAZ53_05375 [Bacteroidetes bacterium]|nr:MAG: hypothetical protein EAZ53_05375 [Bacteroidota bacterium]
MNENQLKEKIKFDTEVMKLYFTIGSALLGFCFYNLFKINSELSYIELVVTFGFLVAIVLLINGYIKYGEIKETLKNV